MCRLLSVFQHGKVVLQVLTFHLHSCAAWLLTELIGRWTIENRTKYDLRVLEVSRLDFGPDTGADRIRCEAMLEHATVPQPFSVLVSIGMEAARTRSWRQRDALMVVVGMRRPGRGDHGIVGGGAAQAGARPVRAWDAQRLGVHRAISADATPGQLCQSSPCRCNGTGDAGYRRSSRSRTPGRSRHGHPAWGAEQDPINHCPVICPPAATLPIGGQEHLKARVGALISEYRLVA